MAKCFEQEVITGLTINNCVKSRLRQINRYAIVDFMDATLGSPLNTICMECTHANWRMSVTEYKDNDMTDYFASNTRNFSTELPHMDYHNKYYLFCNCDVFNQNIKVQVKFCPYHTQILVNEKYQNKRRCYHG